MAIMVEKKIDLPIRFKGLEEQYIVYYLILIIVSAIVFVIMTSLVNNIVALVVCLAAFLGGAFYINLMNRKYGRDGLMKKRALNKVPKALIIYTKEDLKTLKDDSSTAL